HLSVAEAEAFHDTGAEVLENDVAFGCDPKGKTPSSFRPEVDRDAPLPAVLLCEVHRDASHAGVSRARQVAFGRLDLDDVGTEVDEGLAAAGTGEDAREVDDPDATERIPCGHRSKMSTPRTFRASSTTRRTTSA